ncbi:PqqD family protein [Spirosoma aerophilum]
MSVYVRNPDTVSGQIDDEIVMVDIEKGSYFALNAVATRIWELLQEAHTMESLCEKLQAEYEVSAEQCRNDVAKHVLQMQTLGLIRAEA